MPGKEVRGGWGSGVGWGCVALLSHGKVGALHSPGV